MKSNRQHFGIVVVLFALGMVLLPQHLLAQNQTWPAYHPPVTQSVPQYVPRYPLDDDAPVAQPPVNQPTPTVTPKKKTRAPQPVRSKQQPMNNSVAPKAKAKKATPTKAVAKKAKPKPKKKAEKKELPPHYGLDYSIYRDRNPIPIDPRKPCNPCLRPESLNRGKCGCRLPGKNGVPYVETEPGKCECGKKHPNKKPTFSVHWPRPFSANLDERFPEKAAERYSPCQKKRIVDILDPLSTFKISNFKRKDNGYNGIGSDPFGCLGESKVFGEQAASIKR